MQMLLVNFPASFVKRITIIISQRKTNIYESWNIKSNPFMEIIYTLQLLLRYTYNIAWISWSKSREIIKIGFALNYDHLLQIFIDFNSKYHIHTHSVQYIQISFICLLPEKQIYNFFETLNLNPLMQNFYKNLYFYQTIHISCNIA